MQDNEQEPSAVERQLDRLSDVCLLVSGVLLVFLIVIFGWLVFGRYILNNTPTWVEQASLLIVVYVTFLGAAVGVRRNTHLSIDFIRDAMPPLPRRILHFVADVALAVFGGFMSWQGWQLVATNLNREVPLLGLSESWRAAPLAIGGALIVVFVASGLHRRLRAPGS